MTDRKKPGAAFWVTVVVVILLMYPGSFGPACWLVGWGVLPTSATAKVYYPLIWLAAGGPQWVASTLWWYAGWSADGEFALLNMAVGADLLHLPTPPLM